MSGKKAAGASERLRVGVDLGGTKIEGAVMDGAGAMLARRRVDTPSGDYARTVGAVADLVDALSSEVAQAGWGEIAVLGVGAPGALSPASGLIKNANSTCLNGRPLDRDLAQATELPIRLANDANCFALSEAIDGAGAGKSCVFGVILGTGVGGGIVVDGKPLVGLHAIGGEWGHNPLPDPGELETPGPDCYCGRRGCVEIWCSGPALTRDYREASGDPVTTVEEVVARAQDGEWTARKVLGRHLDRLSRALASVVNVLDPDVIVLGGGLSNMQHLYRELPKAMRPHIFSDVFETPIAPPAHGDSSGVRGAAWLWAPDELPG